MAISKAAPLGVAGIQEEIASKADAQVHSGHRLPSHSHSFLASNLLAIPSLGLTSPLLASHLTRYS